MLYRLKVENNKNKKNKRKTELPCLAKPSQKDLTTIGILNY